MRAVVPAVGCMPWLGCLRRDMTDAFFPRTTEQLPQIIPLPNIPFEIDGARAFSNARLPTVMGHQKLPPEGMTRLVLENFHHRDLIPEVLTAFAGGDEFN